MNIPYLIEYNAWANRRVAKQIELIPQELFEKTIGGSFGSIKATLIHLLEAEWLWLKRFHGIPRAASLPEWDTSSAKSIVTNWKSIQEDTLEIVRQLSTIPGKEIDFITRKGDPYKMPLEDIVLHLSHHGSYHRGQLTNMIRQVGYESIGTDYFIFCNS